MAFTHTIISALLASELKRSDLTSAIGQYIELAEFNLARMLQVTDPKTGMKVWPRGFEVYTSSTFTSGSAGAILDPPSRLLRVIAFHCLADSAGTATGSIRYPVYERTYGFIRAYNPNQSTTGRPKYWAHMGTDDMIVSPSPSAAFDFELDYYARPAVLSGANETNWYTDHAPQLLLYEALLQSAPYLKDDERIATWRAMRDENLAAVMASETAFQSDDIGEAA